MVSRKAASQPKAADKAAGAPAPAAPAAVYVAEVRPERRERKAEDMIPALEQIITEAQAQIHAYQHPFQEYPKMVNGLTVQNAKQEAEVLAGTATIEELQSAQGVIRTVK
jgi:hypothetical protein